MLGRAPQVKNAIAEMKISQADPHLSPGFQNFPYISLFLQFENNEIQPLADCTRSRQEVQVIWIRFKRTALT